MASDVLVVETGYRSPERREQNAHGWDEYLIPIIRRHLGEDEPSTADPG